jgi:tetratricopeptide (TPR) repeat protein
MLNDKPAASAGKMENASCKVFRIAPAFLAFCIALLLQGTSFSQKSQQSGTSNKKAGKYFDSAMEAYMKRDNERAMQEVSKAIAEDSVFCEALVLKGDLLSDGKHAAEAIDMYKKVMRINSVFSINLLFITGGLELYLGRYADAKADYSKYLEGKNIPDVKRRKSIAQLASAEFGMAAVTSATASIPALMNISMRSLRMKNLFTSREKCPGVKKILRCRAMKRIFI